MERNGVVKDLGFFLAGALAGGVVAALATPYSGPKMRRMLRYKVEDSRERLSEGASDMMRDCSRFYGRGAKLLSSASLLATGASLFQRVRGYQR
jgi:gas vesicle protein